MPIHVVQAELADSKTGGLIVQITVDYIVDSIVISSTGAVEITESSLWEELAASKTGDLSIRTTRELNGVLEMTDLGTTMRNQLKFGFTNSSGATQKIDLEIHTIDILQAIHKYGTVHRG